MSYQQEQDDDLYGVLALTKDVDEEVFPILVKILKREKIQDCLVFLSQGLNLGQIEQELLQVENQSLFGKEQMVNVGNNNIKRITDVLKKIKDHEFNEKNLLIVEYEKIKKDIITKISYDKKIIEFLKFLVHLTAIDERYIQCGSNSLHILVQMKVDLKEFCFENIRIRNTSLIGANLVRCDLSESELDNVIIRGMNLNGTKLFNFKQKNLGINEGIMLNYHGGRVNSVCFSPDGKSLASCSDDNQIRLWDIKTGKINSIFYEQKEVKSVCFSSKSTKLASCSGKFVFLWNMKTGKLIQKLIGHTNDICIVCFSPDGTTLASGSHDKSIRLWDVKTGQQKANLDSHSSTVQTVCFSPDGTTLASGSHDKSIRLWDIMTGQQKAKLDGHSDKVNTVCFSPDGTTLASGGGNIFGGGDNSIRLWDVKTGEQKCKLDGHSGRVYIICFSPDGTILASGSEDNFICLWDVMTGQQKAKLNGHTNSINSACFSPDGTTLASSSYDKSIHLWNIKREQDILPTAPCYLEITTQFPLPTIKSKILTTTQNINTLILKDEHVNKIGMNLKTLFKQRGSIIQEDFIEPQLYNN